ncbi:MAG: hypothetical protein CMK64_08900 [Pseudoalteromonas sp.]|nr:hypothetical protein [Pseudoalteromonas sp.]
MSRYNSQNSDIIKLYKTIRDIPVFKKLKALLADFSNEFQQSNKSENSIDFNTGLAALLVEVMRADSKIEQSELAKIAEILKTQCELDENQVKALIDKVRPMVEAALDLHQFVKEVNAKTTYEERIEVIELLWHVAFSDGHLDDHEDHIIRKISSLMYVAHVDFIAAKIRVQEVIEL